LKEGGQISATTLLAGGPGRDLDNPEGRLILFPGGPGLFTRLKQSPAGAEKSGSKYICAINHPWNVRQTKNLKYFWQRLTCGTHLFTK
jgi:hypothetical protein